MSQNGESHQNEVCPNCGYCPTCGRGNLTFIPAQPFVPYTPNTTPWYPPVTGGIYQTVC